MLIPSDKKQVLVIVPTYNHVRYIEDALNGILMQKTEYSIVVCILDDCSTDGTTEIVRKYETLYADIINAYCFEKNQYSQRRFAANVLVPWLKYVKYIAICEGDDCWTDPLKLQKQVDYMEEHEECSLCFHNSFVDFIGKPTESCNNIVMSSRRYYPHEIFDKWAITTASVLVRSDVFKSSETIMLLSDKRFVQNDVIAWLCCATRGYIYGMEDVMSVHRRLASGYTSVFEKESKESLKLNYEYCIHNKAILDEFGERFGERFIKVIQDLFFCYNRNGMVLSFIKFDVKSYVKFLKQSWTVSKFRTFSSIIHVPKSIVAYLSMKYFKINLSHIKRNLIS